MLLDEFPVGARQTERNHEPRLTVIPKAHWADASSRYGAGRSAAFRLRLPAPSFQNRINQDERQIMQDNETTDLAVAITCGRLGAKILACEGVTWNDLCTVRHETWYLGDAGRNSAPGHRSTGMYVRSPAQSLGKGILADYRVDSSGGPTTSATATRSIAWRRCRRGTRRLYDRKVVEATDQVHYFITSPANGGGVDPAATGLSGHESGGGERARRSASSGTRSPSSWSKRPWPSSWPPATCSVRGRGAAVSDRRGPGKPHPDLHRRRGLAGRGRALSRRGGDLESAAIWTGG